MRKSEYTKKKKAYYDCLSLNADETFHSSILSLAGSTVPHPAAKLVARREVFFHCTLRFLEGDRLASHFLQAVI